MKKNNSIFKSNLLKWTLVGGAVAVIGISIYFLVANNRGDDSQSDDPPPPEIEQFIKDNTFRIQFIGGGYAYSGTSWIVNRDWTDISTNPYNYYLATNWHVTKFDNNLGWGPIYSELYTMRMSFSDSPSQSMNGGDYTTIDEAIKSQNFGIQTPNGDNINNWKIDLSIIKVNLNFPKYLGHDNLEARLKRVNAGTFSQGHLHNFVNTYTPCSQTNNYYIGGFPAHDNIHQKWESHTLDQSSSGVGTTHNIITVPNTDIDLSGGIAKDESPQYIFKTQKNGWMDGGASGSMIVDKDLAIHGIYWGGNLYTNGDFVPYASIFGEKINNYI